jgi:hypothetical protein
MAELRRTDMGRSPVTQRQACHRFGPFACGEAGIEGLGAEAAGRIP